MLRELATDAHQIYARSKEKLSELPDSAPFAIHAAEEGAAGGGHAAAQAVSDGLRATLLAAPSLVAAVSDRPDVVHPLLPLTT